jgi:DNA gyrase subunit A
VTILPIEAYAEDRYLVTFSRLGKVKKSPLSEYKTADVDGLADMKLAEGDSVVTALLSYGQGEYLVTTDSGQTLRFADDALRAQGRVGQGVAAISLNKGAVVVSAVSFAPSEPGSMDLTSLFIVTTLGTGKKVPLSQYPLKARASVGVASTELSSDDHVLTTLLLNEADTLLLTWTPGSGEQVKLLSSATLQTFLRTRPGVQLVEGHILQVVKI